jgi:formylglycine-generating enzyme required for sulfatase activity
MNGEWITVFAAGRSFMMGSPASEPGREPDETRHRVTFTRDFVIFSAEVTQEWYQAALGYNPSTDGDCNNDCPVDHVSWEESARFCNTLSEAEGLPTCYQCWEDPPYIYCDRLDNQWATPYDCPGYRLPTEAEWEYAAKAGTTDSTYNGTIDAERLSCEQPNAVLDPIAWFCGNSGDAMHEVMTKDPNDWGLYDMLGNMTELCNDWYGEYPGDETDPWGPVDSGEFVVVRGGSWHDGAEKCRAASRSYIDKGMGVFRIGFRPVRTVY